MARASRWRRRSAPCRTDTTRAAWCGAWGGSSWPCAKLAAGGRVGNPLESDLARAGATLDERGDLVHRVGGVGVRQCDVGALGELALPDVDGDVALLRDEAVLGRVERRHDRLKMVRLGQRVRAQADRNGAPHVEVVVVVGV